MIFLSQLKLYILKLYRNLKHLFSNVKNFIFAHSLIQYILISFLTMIVTESFNRRSVFDTLKFLFTDFSVFSVGFCIVLTTLSFTHICKKRNFYKCFLSAVWIILSIVSFIMFSFRLLPFNFNDLLILPGTFTILPKYLSFWHLILIIVAFIIALIIVIKLYRRTNPVTVVFKKDIIFPLSMLFFTLLFCIFARGVGILDNKISGLTNKYERNGFVYCFSSSVFERGMREPTDYSSVEVATIVNDVNKDDSLKRFEIVYPACGSSNSAVKLTLDELEMTSNYKEWIDVCKLPE